MTIHLVPDTTRGSGCRPRQRGVEGGPVTAEGRAVFVYGRLQGLRRADLLDLLVKKRCTPAAAARAGLVVLAHEAAARCIGADHALALPFAVDTLAAIASENGFRRLVGLPGPQAVPCAAPYTLADVARLSGLPEATCIVLRLFDVLAPGGGPFGYADLATARQVAGLLRDGVALAPVVAAAASLGQRGLRVSAVRLVEAPWGGVAERHGGGLARLDGQFALVLDERAADAQECFAAARQREEEGDLPEAERWYGRAEKLDRRDPVLPFNRGNVLAALGRTAEAAIAFRRALDRDRSFAEASFNLARLHEAAGDPAAALPWYRTAIATHPTYAQALYNAARLLTACRRFAEALPLWDRFVALAPDDPDIGVARRLALLCRLERAA